MMKGTDLADLISDVKEQVLYVQELGVESFDVKLSAPVGHGSAMGVVEAGMEPVSPLGPDLRSEISNAPAPAVRSPGASRLASLPSLASRPTAAPVRSPEALEAEAIQEVSADNSSILRHVLPAVMDTPKPETAFGYIARSLPESVETVEQIRAEIGNCTRCALYAKRTQIVHSHGNFAAQLMFVGEAPGADEDAQGFPFVGRAGKLLTDIIQAIGLTRESVFIGNINRCRPPGNRPPVPEETAACRPFLLREVAVVRPRVIVVLGNTATQNLLGIKTPISKLRGNFQDYFGVKVMPTFHPAYLLRDPHKKREVWEDLKKVRDYLAGE
ncbi:MAG TPA: uracil-DNA glycosylase [Pyrinomonadaceae bacterium]|nr:uracil-DNA glycosylase [Pyrinomonadaceae bacterium]